MIRAALAGERLPALVVDLDAFDRNLDRVLDLVRPSRLPLRVATKSVRIPALLRRLQERGGDALRGLMAFSVEEADLLVREGFDDVFVAYPPSVRKDAERAAGLAEKVSVAVDAEPHLRALSDAGLARGVRIRVVLCVDMSLRLLGDRLHLGVRRSPLATERDVLALARVASRLRGIELVGLMGYEAQIAGVADDHLPKRWMRRASVDVVRERRAKLVHALRADGHALTLVNGGGTGSLDSTIHDDVLTEVTCGSAFFKPHLFDAFTSPHVRALEPSCFFALEVTRKPASGIVTCSGGGYVASGALGRSASPIPWLPSGLSLLSTEMAGEVQTPVRVPRGVHLDHGDPILFRHAKAGEICERFNEALLVQNGTIVERVPTYRGLGACFF
jgi:D-serine deaminase-like pyridoxal phosphate-dependent protein